jgi:mono/diheme cytochrome c family protein
MSPVFWLTVLIVLSALLIVVGMRARRIQRLGLRITAIAMLAILSISAVSASVMAIAGMVKANSRTAPIPAVHIEANSEQIERGAQIVESFCSACHTQSGPLTGGVDVGKHLAVPVGSFISANLTPSGALSHWTDGEIFRAIRNGIGADGNWLTIMSYTNVNHLSDADIAALIAYLRSRPPAGLPTVNPPDHFNLLGFMMLGAGLLPSGSPVFAGTIEAPPQGPTAEYGAYILSYQDCRACHGEKLTGGVPGQIAPIGPGLQHIRKWKPEEFIATLRTGKDPAGRQLSEVMPWRSIGRMDDQGLTAVYEYLAHSFN